MTFVSLGNEPEREPAPCRGEIREDRRKWFRTGNEYCEKLRDYENGTDRRVCAPLLSDETAVGSSDYLDLTSTPCLSGRRRRHKKRFHYHVFLSQENASRAWRSRLKSFKFTIDGI
jgi:hypothetical protein